MIGIQTYISLVLFNHVQKQVCSAYMLYYQYKYMYLLCKQVFTHFNITLSYKAVLQILSEIGERHLIPLQRWLEEGEYVQFIDLSKLTYLHPVLIDLPPLTLRKFPFQPS